MFLRLQEYSIHIIVLERLKVFTYLFDTIRIHVQNMSLNIHYLNLEAYEFSHYNCQDSAFLQAGNYRPTYRLDMTERIELNQESHRRISPHNLPLESKFY